VYSLVNTALFDRPFPIVGKRLSAGGLLLIILVSIASFGSIAYWFPAQYSWWHARGVLVNWTPSLLSRIAWTGITGHWCDIWIGLVMLPVGRNSVIGQAFQLHTSTLLFAHKLLAYSFFVGILLHGVLYYVSQTVMLL